MVKNRTFTRAQIVSLLASAVDFFVTWLLVKRLDFPPVAGGATGTLCGGTTHFLISRTWVFSAQEKKWTHQLYRYMLVWIGNFILNTSGLWLLVHYTTLDVLIAKVLIAIVVAVCYNYVLQKRFVFK